VGNSICGEEEVSIVDPENECDVMEGKDLRKYLGLGQSGPIEPASLGTSL
jgi:hypothetical protein